MPVLEGTGGQHAATQAGEANGRFIVSIRIMQHVWENGPEDRGELLVLLALADFADEKRSRPGHNDSKADRIEFYRQIAAS